METERLLKSANLNDSQVGALLNDIHALIEYIYSNCVDWNNSEDIGEWGGNLGRRRSKKSQHDLDAKEKLVQSLAQVNELSLDNLGPQLVSKWLDGVHGGGSAPAELNDVSDRNDVYYIQRFLKIMNQFRRFAVLCRTRGLAQNPMKSSHCRSLTKTYPGLFGNFPLILMCTLCRISHLVKRNPSGKYRTLLTQAINKVSIHF